MIGGWQVLVLTAVIGGELYLLLKSWRIYRTPLDSGFKVLGPRFREDIRARAGVGLGPDWARYRAEADHHFEQQDDRLRSLSAAALALGLGGTILSLVVHLGVEGIQAPGTQELTPMDLLSGTGISLFGSLCGVGVNLIILLWLLPKAEDGFSQVTQDFFEGLQKESDAHPPQAAFTATLKTELEEIRRSLNTEFASAFSTAITGFPKVVEELGGHITKLAEVVTTQATSVETAVGDLSACATAVATSTASLQPTAEGLAEGTRLLVDLPMQLQEVQRQNRDLWAADLRQQHEGQMEELRSLQVAMEKGSEAREQQMLTAARNLELAVSEVRAAVDRMPAHLADEVAESSKRLGTAFGREARDHTMELAARMEAQNELLLGKIEGHEAQWRNNIGSVVEELFEGISSQVEERLVEQLSEVSASLGKAVELLPGVASSLESSHRQWVEVQESSLEGWDQASRRTLEAAERLVSVDGQLQVAVVSLAAGAAHLETIAQVTDEFESDLKAALKDVTADHLKELVPLRHELQRMLQEVQSNQTQFDGILTKQARTIETCIQTLIKGRRQATAEVQP